MFAGWKPWEIERYLTDADKYRLLNKVLNGELGSRVHVHGHWRSFNAISGIFGKPVHIKEYAPEFFQDEEPEEQEEEEIQPFQYKAKRG